VANQCLRDKTLWLARGSLGLVPPEPLEPSLRQGRVARCLEAGGRALGRRMKEERGMPSPCSLPVPPAGLCCGKWTPFGVPFLLRRAMIVGRR
jgi:hypothetical protein